VSDYIYHPLTPERWDDLVQFFSKPGAQSHCWCMGWRLRGGDYNKYDDEGRKAAFRTIVNCGTPTGILMYAGDHVIGWCSVAPRETYERLVRSKVLTTIDDQPSWAVMCFVLDKTVRGQGLAVGLLQAAANYAFSEGAKIVEGYPVEPGEGKNGKPKRDPGAYIGTKSMFLKAGFEEVGRTANDRPILRLTVSHS
jgi:GNAT superfamily N-acetyltransferase